MARNKDFFVNATPKRDKSFFVKETAPASAVSPQSSAVNKSEKPTNPSDLLKKVTVVDYPTVKKMAAQQEQARKEAERQEQERWNNLSLGEKIADPFKTMGTNITYGNLGIEENVAWNEYRNKQDEASLQAAQAATKAREEYEKNNDRIGKGNAVTKDFAQYLPQLGGQLKAGGAGAAGGAAAGGAAGAGLALIAGQLGPQVAVPEELATVPAGALAGAVRGGKAGYVAGTAKYSYDMMAGNAYKTLLDMGVPNDVALELSGDEALVNSLIEGGGAIVDLISLGFGKLASKGGTTAAKEVAKNRLLAAAKAYGLNLVSEPLEEMAQEKVSIETEKKAAEQAGIQRMASDYDDLERIKQAGEGALKVAAVSSGLNAGGNYIANNITENINNNRQTQAQINQDIKNYKNIFNDSENITQDNAQSTNNVKNVLRELPQNAEVQQPNVTLPTQTEMAQKANMNQIRGNTKLMTQRAETTLQSAKIAGANDINMNKAIELNDLLRSGAEVKFYNPQNIPQGVDANKAKVANGFYSNGTVWINKNTKNAVEVVLGHELTHHLETTDSYTDLANTILDSDVFYDYIAEKGYSNVAEYKQSLGQNYTAEQFDSEMVANFVQDKLFSDQNSIDRLARQNTTLVEKIKNWISDLVVSFKGTAQEKELRRIENMYRKALEQARNATTSTDTKYSIAGVKAMENINDSDITNAYNRAQRTGQNTKGWFKDKEGNWKFEFSDEDMTLKKNVRLSDTGNRLGDILEHDILFRAYPELRDTVVNFKEMKRGSGFFHKGTGEITLNKKLFDTRDWKTKVEASLLHEVQHAIQEIEGYPGAANPRWSKKAYYESLGEIEASDTKDRFLKEKDRKLDRNEIKPRSSEPNPKHRMYDKYMNERGIVDKIKDAAFPYYAGKGGKGYEILEEAMVEDNNADLRMDDGRGLRGYVNDTAGKEPAFSMPETDVIQGIKEQREEGYWRSMPDAVKTRFSNDYGYIDIMEKADGVNSIYSTYVEPEYRKQGLGTALLQRAINRYGKDNLAGQFSSEQSVKNAYKLGFRTSDNLSLEETIKRQKEDSSVYMEYKSNTYAKVEETDKVSFSMPETDNQGRTLSKEQQEFFKDSKVRDKNGKLLEVYHGTDAEEFTVFDKELSDEDNVLGQGLYFTADKAQGEKYGSKIFNTYLNIKNPFVINDLTTHALANEIVKENPNADIIDEDYGVASTAKMTEYLIENGYDGIKAGENVYVAFEPNQIKNVDNTNPTSNPDIRYSMNPVDVEKNSSNPQNDLLEEIAPIDEKKLDDVEEKDRVASILTRSPKRPAKDLLKQSADVFMRKLVDAGNTINTVGKLTGDKHLYEYFNNTKQARQSAEYMIGEAQTDIRGNRVGNSLIRIFESVRAKGDDYTNKFFEYLLHMHNIDRMAQNKPVFGKSVTAEDSSRYVKELLEKYPEFEKQANKVYAYNRNLMQWRVDSGLISQEQADLMNQMYPHYVPTFRDVSGTSGSRAMQGTVQIANTVRKATGSDKDIMPIDASMARQTMQTVQAAKRNLLGNRLLNDVLNNKDKVGEYVQAVEKVNEKKDVEAELESAKDTNLDSNNNVFKIFRNGETYVMKVNNGIYEGLKSISSEIDNTDTNLLLKPVKAANNAFKKLITGYSPMFTIRNFARDIQDAGLYSKNLREFLKKYPNAYKEMMGNGKMWQLYKSLGGTGSSFFDYETGIEKTLDSRNKASTKIKEATVGKVEELNMMIEQAPRFAEFMATIEKAGNRNYDTLMEAMLNAADITVNFGRSGTVVKEFNSTFVPFLNPSIQGFDKFTRTVLESRDGKKFAKLAIRATLLGILPSVINELIYWDDDEYENLTDRDKDTNFLIKTGDNKWVKIPKGRVLSIFGNTATRGLRTLKGEEWDAGEFLKNQASQTAPISVLESNIASPIQAVKNNKTWYGSDIVPQRLQDYAPKDQYDENTDTFSKWLGGKINYSPKKINYLIDAYTGIVGDVVLPLMTPKAETNPFTKAFVLDGVSSNEISNDFYDMMDKYNTKQNPKKSAKEVSRYLNKQSKQVSDIFKQVREVENSDLSDAEKRKRVRELRELANTIELTTMAIVPEYEKAVDKYRGTFPDEDVDSEYAYLYANRDVFGAEYAVKTFSKALYNNHQKENMDRFFNNYFTKQYFQKKIEPETKGNSLPTQAQQRAKLPPLKK